MFRTFKYRLRLRSNQARALDAILESQRQLYNECLGWKQLAWDCFKANISKFDMQKWLTQQRGQKSEMAAVSANIQRGTLQRLDKAFASFFRRCKAGEKPGYPRFKSRDRWDSFEFDEFQGITFKGRSLKLKGVPGRLRLNLHRPLPVDPQFVKAVFHKTPKGWEVSLVVKVEVAKPVVPTRQIGIDVGLTHLATLSNGEQIANPRHTKLAAQKLRRVQRQLAHCQRGSNRRQRIKLSLGRVHTKIQNSRQTYLHQVSAKLVRDYDLIALEDLNVKGMTRSRFATSINDAAWATLKFMLTYKAEDAGKRVICVDPKNTSQECSNCGELVPKDLSVRVHSCPHCNLVLGRDHNAALNILHRAVVSADQLNVTDCRERAGGTLVL